MASMVIDGGSGLDGGAGSSYTSQTEILLQMLLAFMDSLPKPSAFANPPLLSGAGATSAPPAPTPSVLSPVAFSLRDLLTSRCFRQSNPVDDALATAASSPGPSPQQLTRALLACAEVLLAVLEHPMMRIRLKEASNITLQLVQSLRIDEYLARRLPSATSSSSSSSSSSQPAAALSKADLEHLVFGLLAFFRCFGLHPRALELAAKTMARVIEASLVATVSIPSNCPAPWLQSASKIPPQFKMSVLQPLCRYLADTLALHCGVEVPAWSTCPGSQAFPEGVFQSLFPAGGTQVSVLLDRTERFCGFVHDAALSLGAGPAGKEDGIALFSGSWASKLTPQGLGVPTFFRFPVNVATPADALVIQVPSETPARAASVRAAFSALVLLEEGMKGAALCINEWGKLSQLVISECQSRHAALFALSGTADGGESGDGHGRVVAAARSASRVLLKRVRQAASSLVPVACMSAEEAAQVTDGTADSSALFSPLRLHLCSTAVAALTEASMSLLSGSAAASEPAENAAKLTANDLAASVPQPSATSNCDCSRVFFLLNPGMFHSSSLATRDKRLEQAVSTTRFYLLQLSKLTKALPSVVVGSVSGSSNGDGGGDEKGETVLDDMLATFASIKTLATIPLYCPAPLVPCSVPAEDGSGAIAVVQRFEVPQSFFDLREHASPGIDKVLHAALQQQLLSLAAADPAPKGTKQVMIGKLVKAAIDAGLSSSSPSSLSVGALDIVLTLLRHLASLAGGGPAEAAGASSSVLLGALDALLRPDFARLLSSALKDLTTAHFAVRSSILPLFGARPSGASDGSNGVGAMTEDGEEEDDVTAKKEKEEYKVSGLTRRQARFLKASPAWNRFFTNSSLIVVNPAALDESNSSSSSSSSSGNGSGTAARPLSPAAATPRLPEAESSRLLLPPLVSIPVSEIASALVDFFAACLSATAAATSTDEAADKVLAILCGLSLGAALSSSVRAVGAAVWTQLLTSAFSSSTGSSNSVESGFALLHASLAILLRAFSQSAGAAALDTAVDLLLVAAESGADESVVTLLSAPVLLSAANPSLCKGSTKTAQEIVDAATMKQEVSPSVMQGLFGSESGVAALVTVLEAGKKVLNRLLMAPHTRCGDSEMAMFLGSLYVETFQPLATLALITAEKALSACKSALDAAAAAASKNEAAQVAFFAHHGPALAHALRVTAALSTAVPTGFCHVGALLDHYQARLGAQAQEDEAEAGSGEGGFGASAAARRCESVASAAEHLLARFWGPAVSASVGGAASLAPSVAEAIREHLLPSHPSLVVDTIKTLSSFAVLLPLPAEKAEERIHARFAARTESLKAATSIIVELASRLCGYRHRPSAKAAATSDQQEEEGGGLATLLHALQEGATFMDRIDAHRGGLKRPRLARPSPAEEAEKQQRFIDLCERQSASLAAVQASFRELIAVSCGFVARGVTLGRQKVTEGYELLYFQRNREKPFSLFNPSLVAAAGEAVPAATSLEIEAARRRVFDKNLLSYLRGCSELVTVVLGVADSFCEALPPESSVVLTDKWAEGLSAQVRQTATDTAGFCNHTGSRFFGCFLAASLDCCNTILQEQKAIPVVSASSSSASGDNDSWQARLKGVGNALATTLGQTLADKNNNAARSLVELLFKRLCYFGLAPALHLPKKAQSSSGEFDESEARSADSLATILRGNLDSFVEQMAVPAVSLKMLSPCPPTGAGAGAGPGAASDGNGETHGRSALIAQVLPALLLKAAR